MADLIDKQQSLDFVFEMYEKMKDHKVNLAYEGEITHQITKAFTALTESNMAKEDDYNSVQRKVFHVMVECLQNISKHAEGRDDSVQHREGRGIFLVSKDENEYNVTTGNVIRNEKVDGLRNLLDNINNLDREGLKKLYKQQIRDGRLSEKDGAGLGFIDIARKTGEKLIYTFLPINDKRSFFILISTISRKMKDDDF